MKKGFTLVEVTILLVIFLIVAFLVAPLSMDDTMQAKYTSKWRSVQPEFENIFNSLNALDVTETNFEKLFFDTIQSELKEKIKPYNISFINKKHNQKEQLNFDEYRLTQSEAVLAIKILNKNDNNIKGMLMYDVNGPAKPNIWGKDVFGMYIYTNRFEPFGKNESAKAQKLDCSKLGTGLYCSNYYLIGGNFE